MKVLGGVLSANNLKKIAGILIQSTLDVRLKLCVNTIDVSQYLTFLPLIKFVWWLQSVYLNIYGLYEAIRFWK
jgi:hypothetical protein